MLSTPTPPGTEECPSAVGSLSRLPVPNPCQFFAPDSCPHGRMIPVTRTNNVTGARYLRTHRRSRRPGTSRPQAGSGSAPGAPAPGSAWTLQQTPRTSSPHAHGEKHRCGAGRRPAPGAGTLQRSTGISLHDNIDSLYSRSSPSGPLIPTITRALWNNSL